MRDIHRETAAEHFGIPESAVTPSQRDLAKSINFARMYGGAKLMAHQQELLDKAEAMTLQAWPGVAKLRERGILMDETSIIVNGRFKAQLDRFNIKGTQTGRSEC